MDPALIGAYWGARQQSADEVAQLLTQFLNRLAAIDSSLAEWFKTGATKSDANQRVEREPRALKELLLAGRNRTDFGHEVIEHLGFRVDLWNGEDPSIGLSAALGAYPPRPTSLNNVLLRPPPADELRSLYVPGTAEKIFAAVIETWRPDWATWTTRPLRRAQHADPRTPVIGWLTYIRDDSLAPPTAHAESFAEGVLIRAAAEFGDVRDDEILSIRENLAAAGLLAPIP